MMQAMIVKITKTKKITDKERGQEDDASDDIEDD